MKPARRINEPSPDRSLNTEAGKEICVEKHYSVSELASSWQLSENTIRRMFEDEPGVLRWGTTEADSNAVTSPCGFPRRWFFASIASSGLQGR
jgi:hypothetical protein